MKNHRIDTILLFDPKRGKYAAIPASKFDPDKHIVVKKSAVSRFFQRIMWRLQGVRFGPYKLIQSEPTERIL